jgi:hypothetical protein
VAATIPVGRGDAEGSTMGCGKMMVACDDGFQVITKDKGELVSMVQWHVDHSHHRKVSEDEVMGMAKHP